MQLQFTFPDDQRTKRAARWRVHELVRQGKLPQIKTCLCVDCGQPAQAYDHWQGYAREHWEHVQPVCHSCNEQRALARGERATGEQHVNAKLTADDIRAIRASTQSLRVLARQYGVLYTSISGIRHGRTWKHLL